MKASFKFLVAPVILCVVGIPLPRCFAFPIEPVSLRQMIRSSDLVVVARVEPGPRPKTDSDEITGFSFRDVSPARLRASTVLKGSAPDGLIEVHFNPNMICPSPPRFPEGTNVLAFLCRSPEGKGYSTVALSYGAKTVSEAEARAYSERITAWLDLERQYHNDIPTNAVVEWLVKCVETPVTKWEGAFELADRRPYLGSHTVSSPFAPHLSEQQRLRISNVVFSAEYITSGDLALLQIFKVKAKSPVIHHLLDCLRRASKPIPPIDTPYTDHDGLPEPWIIFDAMGLLAELLYDADAQAFVSKLKRTDFFSSTNRIKQLATFLPLVDAAAAKKGLEKASGGLNGD
ncbi:MAG: hypothetical protein HY343_05875 [Lentisphaerae bacterium]|nr:hypothetical protein [Lentisphaerota bacterium]